MLFIISGGLTTLSCVPTKTPKNGIIIVNDTKEKIDDSALKNTFKTQ